MTLGWNNKLIPLFFLWVVVGVSCVTNAGKVIGSDYLYAPPFKKGERFLIVQGFAGSKSHQTPLARYAIDLAMPEGEPVCAARSGVVVDLYDGASKAVSHFVHIKHEDGTVGDYEHLQKASITLQVGDSIKKGQCFARVGNTGYSTGPHLHFAVLRRQERGSFAFVSVPFRFSGSTNGIEPNYLVWLEN